MTGCYTSIMVSAKVPITLFRPGAGGLPPYLAGRDRELAKMKPLRESLRDGTTPSRDIVLYGPRGNGKTVLMKEFLRRAIRKDKGIPNLQVIRLTPNQIRDLPALCRHLVLERPGRKLLDRIKSIRQVDLKLTETGMPGMAITFETPAETRLLPDILRDRARAGPTAIAVDEAHTLDREVGRELLNLAQNLRDEKECPVLLMLAGTPGLRTRLGAMNATFWDRCRKIPVPLLNDSDAAAALTHPLEQYGVKFDDEALREVVSESNGYPFFVQLWGAALTQDASLGERVTKSCVHKARPDFEEEKNAYYAERYGELKRRGVLEAAERVAPLFIGTDSRIDEDAVLSAMEARIRERAPGGAGGRFDGQLDALDHLVQLGYIWGDAAEGYLAGIPSLMDYVESRARGSRVTNRLT